MSNNLGENMNKSNNKFAKTIITLAVGVTLTACGGSSSNDSADVTPDIPSVPEVNSSPVISSTSNETATVDTLYSYTLQATDSDNDILVFTSSNLPSWLSFDAETAVLSGTPTNSDVGEHPITLTVSDGNDSAIDQFTITVAPLVITNVNNAAVITSSAISNATVDANYSYTLMASDADNDALTMTATIPTGLSWLSFDPLTGILSGIPTVNDIGTITITLTVNDGTIDTIQTFDITVVDIASSETVNDFENTIDSYVFNNFNGGVSTVIINPEPLGINDSAQVVQMQKFAGEVWGGSTYDLETPVNIAAGSHNFTMKVWSQRAVPVLLKLEGMTELSSAHTGSGWEELSYDFTLADGTLSQVTIIFDLGVNGAADTDEAAWTFYYDDITTPNSVAAVTPPITPTTPDTFISVGTPFDFEATGLGADFTWAVFENDENLPLEFTANPNPSDVNDSDMVAKFTAKQVGQPWAGTETANATPTFTMDATNSVVKIMVYKSVISDVGIKFSVGAAAQPEIKVANTKINEWEELTFDFSDRIGLPETIGITSVIVFPDFNARDADTINYFDNIRFGHF